MSTLRYILATLLAMCVITLASPYQQQQQPHRRDIENHQPRAVQEYVYMALTTIAPTATSTSYTNVTCPTSYVYADSDCPSGCVAAPCAGLIGIATSKFTCETSTPVVSWTSYEATSTCDVGSVVTTYTLWGGQTENGCKETGS